MQGFDDKKTNLFVFLAGNPCYSHNCAKVTSEGTL